MEINKEIKEILKDHKIDVQSGILVLLGVYYQLDVDRVCPEEIIKAINITKIVDRDYRSGIIKWNIPLFLGQEINWSWVKEWNDGFGEINPERKDNLKDVTKRMQEFFGKYPQYRVDDVVKARDEYFKTVGDIKFLKSSALFIAEGISKASKLLTWCEKVVEKRKHKDGDII